MLPVRNRGSSLVKTKILNVSFLSSFNFHYCLSILSTAQFYCYRSRGEYLSVSNTRRVFYTNGGTYFVIPHSTLVQCGARSSVRATIPVFCENTVLNSSSEPFAKYHYQELVPTTITFLNPNINITYPAITMKKSSLFHESAKYVPWP